MREDPRANLRFQQWTADKEISQLALEAAVISAADEAPHLVRARERRALLNEILRQAGEELLEDLAPARQEDVRVPALGHAFPVGDVRRELVALQEHYFTEGVGERVGGQQPAPCSRRSPRPVH